MLERIVRDSLRGITVVEEDVGSINRIFSRQIAEAARLAGMQVCFVTLEEEAVAMQEAPTISPRIGGSEDISATESQARGRSVNAEAMLASLDYNMIVINAFSSYFVDKTERDAVKMIREIKALADQGKSFIINYEPGILSDRATAFLRSTADNVIIIRTQIYNERVERSIYVPKVAGEEPLDRLIKVTVDAAGVQEDTREFVG